MTARANRQNLRAEILTPHDASNLYPARALEPLQLHLLDRCVIVRRGIQGDPR